MAAHDAPRVHRPWWLLAAPALAALTLGFDVWNAVANSTDPGASFQNTAKPYVIAFTVTPAGDAFGGGLRSGDLLDVRALQPAARYRLVESPFYLRGERVTIPVVRHGQSLTLTFTAMRRAGVTWDAWFAYAGNFWVILFALLIAWRLPQNLEARIVSLFLGTMILAISLSSFNWVTPWPRVDVSVNVLGPVVQALSMAIFVTYTMLFARPASRLRGNIARLAYALCALNAAYFVAFTYAIWPCVVDPFGPQFGFRAQWLAGSLTILGVLLCAITALVAARGLERTRLSWAMLSVGAFYSAALLLGVVGLLWPAFNSEPIVNVLNFALPLGLTYSVLNRRLLDIGFALNRATVFTIVSLVIVGIFMLAEWLMGTWLASQSHVTNLAVGGALVVALGFSSRAIHRRVEGFVDTVFFRKRHEDEQAILEFAREASYATDSRALMNGAIGVLESRADASRVSIEIDDGRGYYGGVGENDPAILALRTRHRPIDLHEMQSAFRGEFAYPMAAGGRLLGVLILGPKRSEEPYAPDESKAIAALATAVAAALAVHALVSESMSLPEAIAHRLGRLGAN